MSQASIEIIGDGEVVVGERTTIGAGAKVIFHGAGKVTIGDYCVIGSGVKIIVDAGAVRVGDWTSLHDNCLVLGGQGVEIGQHGWFGQSAILDGTGKLTIGNGVRVGMYSQIWSHVAAGEQIEGCTLYGQRPVVLEDDVWLVGTCICGSGVTIGRRSIALIGSNITRSWPANVVLSGSPAKPREGLSFYRDVTLDEKWEMLGQWLADLAPALGIESVSGQPEGVAAYRWADSGRNEAIVFVKERAAGVILQDFSDATICNVETKTYTKRLTDIEQKVLKALSGNKARFLAEI